MMDRESNSDADVDGDGILNDTEHTAQDPDRLTPSQEVGNVHVSESVDCIDDSVEDDPGRIAHTDEKILHLERDIDAQNEQISELNNTILRVRADADNYRKRIEKEKAESIQFANSGLLLDIIEILDNFERALTAIEKTAGNATLFDGVELIRKDWVSMLKNKWGVNEIHAIGQVFDPQMHEAVAIEEKEDARHTYVGEEFQKGYLIHSRVLRPSRVRVIKPKS